MSQRYVDEYGNSVTAPDCGSCWKKESCERAEEGNFCTEWASVDPKEKDRGKGPAELWSSGEEDWI